MRLTCNDDLHTFYLVRSASPLRASPTMWAWEGPAEDLPVMWVNMRLHRELPAAEGWTYTATED